MKNKPNFFLITGVSQTGGVGGGGPPLGNFSHIIPFFSLSAFLAKIQNFIIPNTPSQIPEAFLP